MVVLGDFNAHLSDSRSGQLENTRGKLLRMMFNKFNMTSINTQDYCSGSKYTYVSATGNTVVDYMSLLSIRCKHLLKVLIHVRTI